MSFLDVFEGVEYESAIIPKLTRVMGISELVCESSIIGETLPTVLAIRKPNSVKSFIKLICMLNFSLQFLAQMVLVSEI